MLSTILTGIQRMGANKQAIESLAPKINYLFEVLRAPISEDDAEEDVRRRELGR